MLVRITNSFGVFLMRDPEPTEHNGRDAIQGYCRPESGGKWEIGVLYLDKGSVERVPEPLELEVAA